jgi:hypothetical protein
MRGALVVLFVAGTTSACRQPTAEEAFRTAHGGSSPDCRLGGTYTDCEEIARLEKDPVKRDAWLELGCTHDRGDLCVELVGTSDYPKDGIDEVRAATLLTKGCTGRHPGRSCAELVYRRSPMVVTVLGGKEADAVSLDHAQRACSLGSGSLPMLGLGPSACYYVARAYLDGKGRPQDPRRAALLFEEGCEQELALTTVKGGPSCFYAARVYAGQPLVGAELPDRTPIDAAKAKALLERACTITGQTDCCNALAPKP